MDTSFLTQQVTTIIGQLHNVFDEIGVPHHERDSRESDLFSSLSETLHAHLKLVNNEKNEMIEQGQRIITTIKQMEASLDDAKSNASYTSKHDDLKITYPLVECLQTLKEKHKIINKLHQERFEQVKKLVQALESYSSHLEPTFLQVKLPTVSADGTIPPTFDLSPSYITSVDNEFTRVYEEYMRRISAVRQMGEEIVKLWAELGTPQAQTDSNIVENYRDTPEQLGLHKDDINRLRSVRDKLVSEKSARERKLKELRTTVEGLWDRLNVDEAERRAFTAGNRGCGLRAINDLEDELSRLNELKRQNLGIFVEDARAKLQVLWDELYLSEEEAVEFTPMFCDVVSDALLSAHEAEIARLEALKEQRAPTLQMIAKHISLIKDRDDLVASSQDGSRLLMKGAKGEKRDPTRLLREEKMRKRIAKELPKVEQELAKVLGRWEEEYGRPFLVFGERYVDVLAASSTKAPPPRSKTPNGLQSAPKAKAAQSAQKAATAPRPAAGTLRSKTPVGTIGRNAPAATTSAANRTVTTAQKSPSRIPARVPLGTMAQGTGSPERRLAGQGNTATRKMGPPMAPPPKMRDLFAAPPSSTPQTHPHEDVYRSGSVVRQMPPEDPYGGNYSTMSYSQTRMMPPPSLQHQRQPYPNYESHPDPFQYSTSSAHTHHAPYKQNLYYHTDAASIDGTSTSASGTNSRQISSTSLASSHNTAATSATQATSATGASSENWETYEDDGCGSEAGSSNAYAYSDGRQPQHYDPTHMRPGLLHKRGVPEDGFSEAMMQGKRIRAGVPVASTAGGPGAGHGWEQETY